jgi:hypothetical protein
MIETITGAAHWASYLINNDSSSLDDSERALADTWRKLNRIASVIDCEDEARFSWHFGLHTGSDFAGGEVVDYTCEVQP